MKINKLRLKGFIGIKKGLGLDEISLDFSDLSGLIAFAGPNGHGKTTILDCLQPYRQMASRNRSLQHHCFLRDSEKELEFEFQGDQYRTLLKIDAESDRSEGFIWKNGESLVDGKVTNYDKSIIKLFGSPALFFNSVFCAQNSKKLNDMTTGDLKKLFSEFLRLDRLIEYENTSKQCNNLLSAQAEKLEREIKSLKELVDIYGEATAKLQVAKTDKQRHEQSQAELANDLKQAEAKLSETQALIQRNELIRTKIKGLQDSYDLIEKEIKTDQEQSKIELEDLRSKYRDIDTEITKLQSLLSNEGEIRKANDRWAELTVVNGKRKDLLKIVTKDHFATVQERSKKEAAKSDISLTHEKLVNAVKKTRDQLSTKIESAKLRTVELNKRDPECKSSTCSFITSALSAQKDIPKLTEVLAVEVSGLSDMEKAHSDALNQINAEIEALRRSESDKKSEKDQLEAKILASDSELTKLNGIAIELPKIEGALAKKSDLEKQRAGLTDEGTKIKATWGERIIEKERQNIKVFNEIAAADANINKDAETNLPVINNSIDLIKSSITDHNAKIAEISGTILSLEKEIVQKEQAQNDFEAKAKERSRVIAESSEWAYLKNACGKDGLRALEIDSVAPVVTGYANDLLLSTFGPAYTVKFRTQDEETGREVLDILVIREDGSEVLLDNLSGGEKVWSLKALRLAMTLISKEKSGKAFGSVFCDEEDGALDTDNAQHFISLYRSFMASGGFDDCYFISHKPECVSMADHVIEFGNGGVKIN